MRGLDSCQSILRENDGLQRRYLPYHGLQIFGRSGRRDMGALLNFV